MTNPNTLDPNEINKLPFDRSKQFNGLTEAQVRAIGADPDEVEAGRLASSEWAAQQARANEAEVLVAAQQAVADGELTPAEAAQALQAGGFKVAHAALVEDWRAEEAGYAEEEFAADLPYLSAQQYIELHNSQQATERAQLEQQAQDAAQRLKVAQVTEIQSDLKEFVDSVPSVHQIAPAVERQLVADLQASGTLPATPEERQAAIEVALRKTAVIGAATESLKQQVDQEWRFHRRNNGKTDGLMTAANIADAERHWKAARFEQLADAKQINTNEFNPAPTAAEESAALTEKYRAKQDKSTDLHRQVAGIAERGAEADATRDRGVGIGEEKKAYREALARAEAEASFGSVPEIKTGYGATHEATVDGHAAQDPRLPEGWVDEYGPAGYSG